MEYYALSRCLMCRKPILENLSIDSENLVSTAHLLQSFLNCFHINVLDNQVHDLSTSCQFCPTCEQFVAEWNSIQTMMTQLTQHAAQLKATISAVLLSAPQIQKQEAPDDVDITNIINNRTQNSQDVQLSLLLKQTVDYIRNELYKEYSVSVMVDKIQLPCPPSNLNQEELDPLSDHCDNDDEPMNDWRGDNGSDAEYSPSEDQMDIEEKSEQIFETKNTTEDEATSSDDSIDSVELKEIKAKRKSKSQTKVRRNSRTGCKQSQKKPSISKFFISDGPNRFKYEGIPFQLNDEYQTYTCDACGFKSSPTERSIREYIIRHVEKLARGQGIGKRPRYQKKVVPDGPNKFKYNGHGFKLNVEDQCYYCDACDFKGNAVIHSVLLHIREVHHTEEEKQKLAAVQISDTEWVYGGEYKIIRKGEKLKCVSCEFECQGLNGLTSHIESFHVGMESADKVAPFQVTDKPSVKDLTHECY